MRHFRRLALLPVPVALTVACGPAMAVSTWVGGAAPNPSSMNNPANWTGGTPVSGAPNLSLVFPSGTAFSTVQQDLANPLILQSLTIERIYAFSGNGFRFSNLGANPTFHTTSTFTLDAPVEFAAPTTISGANRLQLGGTLTGSADVMMSGTGFRDVLINGTGTNPYSGTITVSGSNNRLFLAQSGGHATSGSFIVDNGARLHVNTGNQFAANSDLTVLNAAEFHSDGRLGAQDRVRNLTVSGGVVGIYSSLVVTGNISSAGGSSEIYGGSLDLDGNETIIKVTGTGATDVLHLGSTITNGRFEKTGAGILSLSSDSPSYNGVNKITAGTLRTNAHAMGTVVNNATLELWGGNLDTDQISGSGSVRLTGNVWYNAAQTYTGTTNLANFGSASGSVATLLGNFHGEAGAFNAQVIFVQPADGVFTGTLTGDVGVQQHGEGTLTLNGGNTYTQGTKLANGVLRVTSDSSLGSGTGALTFGGGVFAAVGTRTFANPLIFSEVAAVVGDGNVTFTDTNTKTVYSTLIHASSGSTTINGKMAAGASGNLVVTGGHLTVGSPAHVGGFVSQGPIYVTSGATLTLRSLNFVTLPEVTLAGGTLRAPNGYAIPTGAALQGSGGVTGRVASANGSTILASGNLDLGDAAHVAGVNLDGELYTHQHAVTLFDQNQAVLGSLTQLGTAGINGSLIAKNGLVVNFGRNLAGRGQIVSENALAQAVIMNGDATGRSIHVYLEFTGYVKGIGSFNNVAFSGTFAPGLSPALVTVGSIIFTSNNLLDMEIGGLDRGSQYDAMDATTNLVLGGTLQLSLINGFMPAIGDQFDLFNGPMSGTFSGYNFAVLTSGQWDTSLLYSQGIVQVVVPEPTLISFGLLLIAPILRRRRR